MISTDHQGPRHSLLQSPFTSSLLGQNFLPFNQFLYTFGLCFCLKNKYNWELEFQRKTCFESFSIYRKFSGIITWNLYSFRSGHLCHLTRLEFHASKCSWIMAKRLSYILTAPGLYWRDSLVSTLITLQARCPNNQGVIPGKRRFLSSPDSRSHPVSYSMGTVFSFGWDKADT